MAPEKKRTGPTLVVRQVKSGIGFAKPQKLTLRSLGLGKIGRQRTLPDNPAVRGMISAVTHLVEVVESGSAPADRTEKGT